jgi:hypothetical protein
VGGDGGVTDERHFVARREESHLQVVVAGLRLEHEGGFAVDLGGDGLHLRIGEVVRIQHHDGGIAGEALASERVDVEQPAVSVGHGVAATRNKTLL